MNTEIYTIDGKKKSGSVELADAIFGIKEINKHLIYEAINCELANKRQGTASTKEKGVVSGSGKKPWRQKGTGRARAGYKRSPVWRGGGIAFGPHPREYTKNMPKKQKRLSFKNIFSMQLQQGKIKIVEDFKIESGRTKDAFNILKSLTQKQRVLVIYKEDDTLFKRAFRNIPWVTTMSYKRLTAHDVYYAREILIMQGAAEELNKFF